MNRAASRLLRAGLLTAVVDGTFSSVLSVFFYHSTVARLFQGVASTLLGPSAIDGGARPVAIGLLMHTGVAFGWSTVFLILVSNSAGLRRIVASRSGVIAVAAVYGPLIWTAMSCAVIPSLLHRPPTFNNRWWIQLIGHFPFVGMPIVSAIGGGFWRERAEI